MLDFDDLWRGPLPPLSFTYGGEASSLLFPRWDRAVQPLAGPVSGEQIAYADPDTSLRVIAQVRRFSEPQAWEWVLELENAGPTPTPILAQIMPLDRRLSVASSARVYLHHAKGSQCQPDDFLPLTSELRPGQELRYSPVGGRSSNGHLPFFNLQVPGGGFILAIGWSGQWQSCFRRSGESVQVTAGMERTHLRLLPGERIRTPRLLLIPWEGDDPIAGNNYLRRVLFAHYLPRLDGQVALPPISHNTMYNYYATRQVSEKAELEAIDRAAELGIEAYWLDACWYGTGREWWQEVGNWTVKKTAFPRGLAPLGEAAHRQGMKFVLWFEPERVRPDTPIAREHPEFLLRSQEQPDNYLFNLGLPEARQYLADLLCGIMDEAGVDVYRQDFNFDPLPYWEEADVPDRVGLSQIRHVEGLYALWDQLRQRRPGLLIDNCAGGGRRLDLETISRSFPLWRSDFSDVGGPAHGPVLQIADQVQTAGLSRWVPLHTGAVWTFSPYDFRSAMAAGIVPYSNIRDPDYPAAQVRSALAELKSLRPFYQGDFYPLLPLTAAAHDWCAYQYHRPDLDAGFAVFFRRHESPFPVAQVRLRGLVPQARYATSLAEGFAAPPQTEQTGRELESLTVQITDRPGSLLLRYHKV